MAEVIDDKAGFYIPEEIIARINPALFLKYKMTMNDKTVLTPEYREFCDSVYEKTSMQIQLVYCHSKVRGMLGEVLQDKPRPVTPKGHVWASPSFDAEKLMAFMANYCNGDSAEKAGMYPFRWEPKKNDWSK